MQNENIYEFIVLQQKDSDLSLPMLMADYNKEACSINGFIASQHFQSFYALPIPDTAPVYVMIYQWENHATIPVARDYLVNTNALSNLLDAADITAFALTQQIEGRAIDVRTLASEPNQVLELAIRRIKPSQEDSFEVRRKAFVAKLDSTPHVLFSAEFHAVMGDNPERLTVGISVYHDQASFQQLAGELMSDPSTDKYFATFIPEALKYLVSL